MAPAYAVIMSHSISSSWTVLSPCYTVQRQQIIPARADVIEGDESSATVTAHSGSTVTVIFPTTELTMMSQPGVQPPDYSTNPRKTAMFRSRSSVCVKH